MTAKKALMALCAAAVLALGAKTIHTAFAQEKMTVAALNRQSLQGLQGVTVKIDAEGFDNEAIRQDVEQWLKRSDIPLAATADEQSTGTLDVRITTATRQSVCAVTINVNLLQQVSLARKPTLTWPCSTWSSSRTLALDKRTTKNALDMALSSIVYDFAFAYLGVNK